MPACLETPGLGSWHNCLIDDEVLGNSERNCSNEGSTRKGTGTAGRVVESHNLVKGTQLQLSAIEADSVASILQLVARITTTCVDNLTCFGFYLRQGAQVKAVLFYMQRITARKKGLKTVQGN